LCRELQWPPLKTICYAYWSRQRQLLKPQMRTISVEHGDVLHSPASSKFAYFPISTIISVLAHRRGSDRRTSIVGRKA
jgi:hypothetical protein